MSGDDTVSIIVPAYNAERTIETAIRSGLRQSHALLEIIVIDDASTDQTAEIVSRLASEDSRIVLLRHAVNRGVAAARNTGLDAATSEWIALLDADDAMAPVRLELLIAIANSRHADLVADNLLRLEEHEAPRLAFPLSRMARARPIGPARFASQDRPQWGTTAAGFIKPLMRRQFLEHHHVRYDDSLATSEDFAFYMTALVAGAKLYYTEHALYRYHVYPKSLSHGNSQFFGTLIDASRTLSVVCASAGRNVHRELSRRHHEIEAWLAYERLSDALRRRRVAMAIRLALTTPGRSYTVRRLLHAARWRVAKVFALHMNRYDAVHGGLGKARPNVIRCRCGETFASKVALRSHVMQSNTALSNSPPGAAPQPSSATSTQKPLVTVMIAHDAPFPPRSGSPLRCWQLINLLKTVGQVHVVSIGLKEGDATLPVADSWMHIGSEEYPSTGSGFVSRFRRLLIPRQYPIENDSVTRHINRRVGSQLDRLDPDVIVLSHWHDAIPDAVKSRHRLVLDVHNVESTLAKRLWLLKGKLTIRQQIRALLWRRSERALFAGVDRIWTTSEDDSREIRALNSGIASPVVVPNAIDVDFYSSVRKREGWESTGLQPQFPTIVYAGFYGYEPNAVAAQHLIVDIFPIISRRFPTARLMLIGKRPTADMISAADRDPRIIVTGPVDNLLSYLALADMTMVPLTEGGGTRLKILEAFASRIPVATTSKGAEGINASHGTELIVADDLEVLAQQAVSLLNEPALLSRQVDAAFRLVKREYSWETLSASIRDVL